MPSFTRCLSLVLLFVSGAPQIGAAARAALPVASPTWIAKADDLCIRKGRKLQDGDFGRGMQALYSFAGKMQGNEPTTLSPFSFTNVKIDTKPVTIAHSRTLIQTPREAEADLNRACKLETDGTLKLVQVQYGPVTEPPVTTAIQRYRIKSAEKTEQQKASRKAKREAHEDARRIPDIHEMSKVLEGEWEKFKDEGSPWGYGREFGRADSTFGEIHDLSCRRKSLIFTCKIGVTYSVDGKPKYEQRELEFERDAMHDFKLILHYPDIIVT